MQKSKSCQNSSQNYHEYGLAAVLSKDRQIPAQKPHALARSEQIFQTEKKITLRTYLFIKLLEIKQYIKPQKK